MDRITWMKQIRCEWVNVSSGKTVVCILHSRMFCVFVVTFAEEWRYVLLYSASRHIDFVSYGHCPLLSVRLRGMSPHYVTVLTVGISQIIHLKMTIDRF